MEPICISNQESELYQLINTYRAQKNLNSIPLSTALTKVAKAHAHDLKANYTKTDQCNPHSWSKKGAWTPCCYTDDHKKASCMWDKPKEIAMYDDPGYEIVYWHSNAATPLNALNGWKKSKGHNEIVINTNQWKQATWNAIGVAIYKNYAVVWFGQAKDAGEVLHCDEG